MDELLKCPYCGGKIEVFKSITNMYNWVCTNEKCLSTTDKWFGTEQKAIKHANRRAK